MKKNIESIVGTSTSRFEIRLSSTVEQTHRHSELLDQVKSVVRLDPAFSDLIELEAKSYLARRPGPLAVDLDTALEMSTDYLLREVAFYAWLSESGLWLEFYPGPESVILERTVRGDFPLLPDSLRDRVFVQVQLKKTGES